MTVARPVDMFLIDWVGIAGTSVDVIAISDVVEVCFVTRNAFHAILAEADNDSWHQSVTATGFQTRNSKSISRNGSGSLWSQASKKPQPP